MAPPRGCSAQSPAPTFCDDFEAGNLAAWDTVTQQDGTVSLESGAAWSGDTALSINGDANPADCTYVTAERTVAGPVRSMQVRARLFLEQADPSAYQLVLWLTDGGDTSCGILVAWGAGGPVIMEQLLTPAGPPWMGFDHTPANVGVVPGVWTGVELRVDHQDRTLWAKVGDVVVLDTPLQLTCPLTQGNVRLAVGLHCVPASSPATHFHVDDVVLYAPALP